MNRHAGFTLVEVVVALVVFSLVVVGLSSVFVGGNKLITHYRERMTSAQLGIFFLDRLQAHVRQDTWDSIPLLNELRTGGPRAAAVPLQPQVINDRSFTEDHTVSIVSGTDLRRVISTIHWTEPSS